MGLNPGSGNMKAIGPDCHIPDIIIKHLLFSAVPRSLAHSLSLMSPLGAQASLYSKALGIVSHRMLGQASGYQKKEKATAPSGDQWR